MSLTIISASAQDDGETLLAEARGGNPQAQLALALSYRDGKGIAKDPAEAMKRAHSAAGQGLAEAMAYFSGEGIAADPLQARSLAERAAERNDRSGLVLLGGMQF